MKTPQRRRDATPPQPGAGASPLGTALLPEPAEVLRHLAEVLRANPALLRDVQAARTPDQAAESLARIAAMHGLPTNGPELRRHVTRLAVQARPGMLADESLDHLHGGLGPTLPEWNSALVGLLTGASTRKAGD